MGWKVETMYIPDSLRMPPGHPGHVHLLPLLRDHCLHHRRVWSVHLVRPGPLSCGNDHTISFIFFYGSWNHRVLDASMSPLGSPFDAHLRNAFS
jgi:hypothetical protein